ncbi:MAG: hypothetical protein ACRCU3_09000 [Eubacteriaceae bacterium]
MTVFKQKHERRTYTDEFKNQLVQLHQNGKRKYDIFYFRQVKNGPDFYFKSGPLVGAF